MSNQFYCLCEFCMFYTVSYCYYCYLGHTYHNPGHLLCRHYKSTINKWQENTLYTNIMYLNGLIDVKKIIFWENWNEAVDHELWNRLLVMEDKISWLVKVCYLLKIANNLTLNETNNSILFKVTVSACWFYPVSIPLIELYVYRFPNSNWNYVYKKSTMDMFSHVL